MLHFQYFSFNFLLFIIVRFDNQKFFLGT
ncbi:hypothetical protein BLA29_010334 [Euroglyphus maynei]|uniref:Uncharacterized protein n=1 Tax=Euroglyphus maynei TaxID=6958 RepID=A0A1Y3BI66_EURMA|nr:hypothetical protein BLA29_010334 [Euroglyphus maynei]